MRGGTIIYPETDQDVGRGISQAILGEDSVFQYVLAVPNTNSISIYWQIKNTMPDPGPYLFDIYRYENFGDEAEGTLIASNLPDTVSYTDTTTIFAGEFLSVAYRVVLKTGANNTYNSPKVPVLAGLTIKTRLLARAILRRLELTARWKPSLEGYLFKRKFIGTDCTCMDKFTKEVKKSDCSICKGTGKVGGYWNTPIKRTITVHGPFSDKPTFDKSLNVGTVVPATIRVRFPALPPVTQYDVWYHVVSQKRFYITEVQTIASLNTLPLACEAVLNQADYSDVAYTLTL